MGFELEDIAKKLDNSNQSGFEMERIATALGGTGNGFEIEKIRDGVMNGSGGGSDENIEYYKAMIRGDVTYFEGDVESVRTGAFMSCSSLTDVRLPNATTIGEGAFANCVSLNNVILPNATTIDSWAFTMTALTSVDLPNVTTIGEGAFANCVQLEEVYLGYSSVVNVGERAFSGCTNLDGIIVPQSLYSEYMSASQWASYSSYLQYEADDSGTK